MSDATSVVGTSVGPSVTSVNPRRPDPARSISSSGPEEGYRLIRSFLSIREPTLRQAIIELVMELSAPERDRSKAEPALRRVCSAAPGGIDIDSEHVRILVSPILSIGDGVFST
jgi:hypothetical protein